MKRFGIAMFVFALWLSLSAIAQDTGQQPSADKGSSAQTTTTQSTTQSTTKMEHKGGAGLTRLKGKISDDGKSITTDKDSKTWTIENPDAVKGHEGHDVKIKGHVDAANNSIHVMSVKMAGEKASKKKSGAMSEQPPK